MNERKLRIGIVGAGNIGGTLTRRLRTLGYPVAVANSRGPETLRDLARETGAEAVSIQEAVRNRDLVIVTIPENKIPDLPKDLFAAVSDDVVVVDTGNYYPQQRDGCIAGIEGGLTESRWVEQHLGRPVIKAFNNIHARDLMEKGQRGAPRAASRCPLPATTGGRRRCCRGSSTSWASTPSTPALSRTPGGSSRRPRSTARTTTKPACAPT